MKHINPSTPFAGNKSRCKHTDKLYSIMHVLIGRPSQAETPISQFQLRSQISARVAGITLSMAGSWARDYIMPRDVIFTFTHQPTRRHNKHFDRFDMHGFYRLNILRGFTICALLLVNTSAILVIRTNFVDNDVYPYYKLMSSLRPHSFPL